MALDADCEHDQECDRHPPHPPPVSQRAYQGLMWTAAVYFVESSHELHISCLVLKLCIYILTSSLYWFEC